MTRNSFAEDLRYCPKCLTYVSYLLAWECAHCAACGAVVTLFSPADLAVFQKKEAGVGPARKGAPSKGTRRNPPRSAG